MLKKVLDLIPDRRPAPLLITAKPMQVRDFPKWTHLLLQHLLETGKDFTVIHATEKADGHSVIFQCLDGNKFAIYPRTPNSAQKEVRTPLLSGDDATRFVTQLACTLRATLTCELRALYEGKEMGFLEVLSMLKLFRTNGLQNVGKFELQLCPFGVHSVNDSPSPMYERGGTFLPPGVVDTLLQDFTPGNSPLTRLVSRTKYRVRLCDKPAHKPDPSRGLAGKRKRAPSDKYELEFLSEDGTQTIATNPDAFFAHLIALADASRIEGFVLEADPAICGKERVAFSTFGVRKRWAVKVKREFQVTLLACKIRQKYRTKPESTLIFTYGLDPRGDIVYAGEQTRHERLTSLLANARPAFTCSTKEEKTALYAPSRRQVLDSLDCFVMTRSSCTNMSKNRFCPIGLKLYDMRSEAVDLSKLSVLRDVAEANPHFCSTRDASNRFAEAIQRGAKKAPRYRSRGSLGGSPPPEGFKPRVSSTQAAPASLAWDDFMDAIGEQFVPTETHRVDDPPKDVVEEEDEPEACDEPEEKAPTPREPSPDLEAIENAENAAFDEHVRRLNETIEHEQEVYERDEDGNWVRIKAPKYVWVTAEVINENGKSELRLLGPGDPAWTKPLPVGDLLIGPPTVPRLPRAPFRVLSSPVNMFIDARGSPDFYNHASTMLRFFGGSVVQRLSPDVHAIVTHAPADPETRARLGSKCAPACPAFLALRDIQAFLRPGN